MLYVSEGSMKFGAPMDFRAAKAQEWDDSIPKMACSTVNHMVISVLSS
jgi:hypothetical protein